MASSTTLAKNRGVGDPSKSHISRSTSSISAKLPVLEELDMPYRRSHDRSSTGPKKIRKAKGLAAPFETLLERGAAPPL